jgi:hypothetical protein
VTSSQQTVYYFSRPAGYGKTYASIQEAAKLLKAGYKIIIVSPSIFLTAQTHKDIRKRLLAEGFSDDLIKDKITSIHGKSDNRTSDTVHKEVRIHTDNARQNEGQILLVTQETFRRMTREHRKHWIVMHDEEKNVVEHVKVPMAEEHAKITDHLEIEPLELRPEYAMVSVRHGSRERLKEIYCNVNKDGSWALFERLLGYLLDNNCKVFTSVEQWNDLKAGRRARTRGGKASAKVTESDFCCLIGPRVFDGYQRVTITCALFEHTMHYKVWTKVFGARMLEHPSMAKHLREPHAKHHLNSNQIEILGAYDEAWTDSAKRVEATDCQNRLTMLAAGIEAEFRSQPYAYFANNGDNPLPKVPNIDPKFSAGHINRGPAMPQGMNGVYEKYDNMAVLGAYNYVPFIGGVLDALGISRHEQEIARNFLTWYQQLMRGRCRNPKAPGTFRWITPTTRFGNWLVETGIMPKAKVGKLPFTDRGMPPLPAPGRKKSGKSLEAIKAEKSARNRADYLKRKAA